MKRFVVTSAFLAVMAYGGPANAAEQIRSATQIVSITPYAAARPGSVSSQKYTRIGVNAAQWGTSTTCNQLAADLAPGDANILSTMLSAYIAGKKVSIAVNDTLTPIDSTCQITYIRIE